MEFQAVEMNNENKRLTSVYGHFEYMNMHYI